MKLEQLIENLKIDRLDGEKDIEIQQIDFDSRKVQENSLFVAIKGTQVDGHNYIEKAISNGATTIVVEQWPENLKAGITYLQVGNSAKALGILAANFFDHPSSALKLVGVTGTNGKTTTVTLLHQLFQGLGYKSGLLSTIENKIGDQIFTATHTTADAVTIHRSLREMVDAGCDFAFMEVSSFGVDQERIAGLEFAVAVFTNMSRDHLDYHKTFQAYIEAKKKFFDDLPASAKALVNLDDKRGNVMVQNTKAKVFGYSLLRMADFKAKILENSLTGLHLEIDNHDFYGRLVGNFNAYNLLAVYATARLLEQDQEEVLTQLSNLKSAEGRFDLLVAAKKEITGIVDYAHTPDALVKVLQTIHQLRNKQARIITIVGCGGDRDKGKRPEMARLACEWSDQVILTSDNPRTEDPLAILEDMQTGVPAHLSQLVMQIANRREAIREASRLAKAGDIILVAGKGHEKYQEIQGVKYPFDDKEVLKEELLEY